MKRYLSLLVLLVMLLAVPSCGGSGDPQPDPREELIGQYAGKYLNTEMILGGEDETESLAAGWADRSSYSYIEITEDMRLIAVQYSGGKDTVTSSYYFDPLDRTVHYREDFSDRGSELFTFSGDRIILDTSISRMVYEKTDELD